MNKKQKEAVGLLAGGDFKDVTITRRYYATKTLTGEAIDYRRTK
jgi:hypothetical protein